MSSRGSKNNKATYDPIMQQLYIFFQFFFVTTTVILEEYFINIIDVIGKNSHLPSRWLKWHVALLCLYRRDLLER